MKRIPVTKASYQKIKPTMAAHDGKTLHAESHKIDKDKTRQAALGGMPFSSFSRPTMLGSASSFYNNSYMGNGGTGFGDVPIYFALLNEQNGGILYYPVTLKQKYQWFRYFYRCFVDKDVQILMGNGTNKKMSELQNGDTIINKDGKKVRVVNKVVNEYKGDIYSVLIENGKKSTFVTADHLYLVIEKESVIRHHNRTENGRKTSVEIKNEPVWKRADQLKTGDYVLTTSIVEENKNNELSIEEARLLGYFLAEGSFLKRGDKISGIRFSFNINECDYHDEVKRLCEHVICRRKIKQRSDFRGVSFHPNKLKNVMTVICRGKELSKWLYDWCGDGSHKKTLNEKIFDCDENTIKNLIATWICGDGTYNDSIHQCCGVTVSENLANQMFNLMVRVGYSPTKYQYLTKNNEKIKGGISYKIHIPSSDCADLSSLCDKVKEKDIVRRYRKISYKNWMLYPIRGIEKKHYEGSVFCITTDGKNYDDCSFVANGLINHNCDAYVHAAINLLTDLPMSKLVLRMPKMRNKKLRHKILKKYETMVQDIKLFDKLHSILFETNVIGNSFAFIQFNEQTRLWDRIVILPPEEVDVAGYPMSNVSRIQYRPEILNALLKKYTFPLDDYNKYCEYIKGLPDEDQDALQGVDYELVKQLSENNGRLIMDTSPYSGDGDSKIGSFVFHFCEKRHEYQDLGVSPIECVLTPLLMKEHYKHTQLSLASRNMTPRNIITANEIPQEALDDLRDQVDQSMLSPDYSIVTNYDVQWNTIGAENRLIDLQREYETIENQLFAGFGVTRELLTGQGMYSGSKISIELLNTKFLLKRELLQRFVEENLFKPIAEEHGFYEQDEDGNRTWFYPRLSFSRLTIRDNSEVFDSLFQLYQKGSIPVGTILDLFNLDEDEIDEKLKKDMFTPKDATYNEMLRSVYSQISDKIANETDLADQIIQSIKGPLGQRLKKQKQEEQEEGGGMDGFGGDNDDYGDDNAQDTDDFTENYMENEQSSSGNEEQKLQEYLDSINEQVMNDSNSNERDENSNSSSTAGVETAQELSNSTSNANEDNKEKSADKPPKEQNKTAFKVAHKKTK